MIKRTHQYIVASVILLAAITATLSYFSSPEVHFRAEKAVTLKSLIQNQRSPASGSRGLDVIIDAGQVAYLDESTNIDTLIINGELHCDETKAPETLELRAKEILVNGVFQCGTKTKPYRKKLIISLKNSGLDPKIDEGYRGINVEHGGKLILNGDRRNSGWYKLNQTITPGTQTIVVNTEPFQEAIQHRSSGNQVKPHVRTLPWKVGDQIVIGPTGYDYLEAEKFTITAIDSNFPHQITLDHPAQYQHWGESQIFNDTVAGTFDLDERAEVANLTRSILIRADEADAPIDEGNDATSQRGGHIMVHNGGQAYIDSVELYKMGQAGVMARYPFHWHFAQDVSGQYIKNSSIHHSYQRCVTVHRTHSALVENNVCFDFKGHGYFLEDGNEINNKLLNNLAIMAKPPSQNKILLASDSIYSDETQGRFPSVSCFWISNPKNTIKNNVASGCRGVGFWMSFEDKVKDLQGNIVATPINEVTTDFSFNSAHASKVGITWDGAPVDWKPANNPNNSHDRFVTSAHYAPPNIPVFTGLKAYKNSLTGIYFRGQTVIFKNSITADNGWSYWVSYNQIVRDSVFIGRTNNNSLAVNEYYYAQSFDNGRIRKTGIVLYDGPFEIHHSDFIDFSTQSETYTNSNGITKISTVIPFTSTGGTNKFTNVVSGLRFIPEPIHRVHNYSADEDPKNRFVLGNSIIRDLDGSLSNTGSPSVLTGVRSLGVTPQSNCQDGGTSFYQFKICPGTYHEGSFAFLRWGVSAWATPFLVKRSDGALNYLKSEWNMFPYQAPNNLFATISNQDYSYELLPYYQYETDRILNANTTIDANHEQNSPNSPIVKIVAYGNNCSLYDLDHPENDALKVPKLDDLSRMTKTSYYSQGEDFYVRIIPNHKWEPLANSQLVTATAYTTMPIRYRIKCDDGLVTKKVVGKITQVSREHHTTTVKGWACNYSHSAGIKVKLYAYGKQPGTTSPRDVYIPIGEMWSNQSSNEEVAFHCGKFSTQGRAFSFSLSNADLSQFTNHRFYVKGISNTGGEDQYIDGSGKHKVSLKLQR
jgi:hypothetical protein